MDENYLDDLLNDISNKGKSNDDFDNFTVPVIRKK